MNISSPLYFYKKNTEILMQIITKGRSEKYSFNEIYYISIDTKNFIYSIIKDFNGNLNINEECIKINRKSLEKLITSEEINLFLKYLYCGFSFKYYDFSNIVFLLEKILRNRFEKKGIISIKPLPNGMINYYEPFNLIKYLDISTCSNLEILAYMILSPNIFNIRNKLIHGQIESEEELFFNCLLLMFFIILLLEEV